MILAGNPVRFAQGLVRSRFVKQVVVVAGGTATAQLVALAFSPLITRLYGPEAFGTLGVFTAMAAFVAPAATLAYGLAVVLPVADRDARSLVTLAVRITIGVSLLLFVAVLGFRGEIAKLFGFSAASAYLVLLPLVVFFSGVEQTFKQWLMRKQQFRAISGVAVTQATLTGAATVGGGLVAATAPMLFVVNAAGHALHAGLLWVSARETFRRDPGRRRHVHETSDGADRLRGVARAYRDFPGYRAPQLLLNSASQSVAPLIVAAFFGPAAAGFYELSRRALAFPSQLVSQSVGTVLLPRLAAAAHAGESLQPMLVKSTLGLAAAGLLPFGVVVLFGPTLFGLVFGSAWTIAGEFSRWLAVWLYFGFVNVPSVQSVALLGLQSQYLVYELLLLFARVGTLVVGASVFSSVTPVIALFAIVGAAMNGGLILWVVANSGTASRTLST